MPFLNEQLCSLYPDALGSTIFLYSSIYYFSQLVQMQWEDTLHLWWTRGVFVILPGFEDTPVTAFCERNKLPKIGTLTLKVDMLSCCINKGVLYRRTPL